MFVLAAMQDSKRSAPPPDRTKQNPGLRRGSLLEYQDQINIWSHQGHRSDS